MAPTNYPFTHNEMSGMAGVISMVCLDANRKATVLRKKRLLTDDDTRNALIDCWESTYVKSTEACGQEYAALLKCLDKNPRRSLKCKKLRTIFEECYVRKVMIKEEAAAKQQG